MVYNSNSRAKLTNPLGRQYRDCVVRYDKRNVGTKCPGLKGKIPNLYLLIQQRLTKAAKILRPTFWTKKVYFQLKCNNIVADNKRSYKKIFSPLRKTSGSRLLLDVFFFYTSCINQFLISRMLKSLCIVGPN